MIPRILLENRWTASAMTLLGIAILTFAMSFSVEKAEPHNHNHHNHDIPAVFVGAAKDIEQLVSEADLIVVGSVGTSTTERTIGPYSGGYDGAPTFPVTDYEITATSVLKGDGSVSPGDTLILREFGHLSIAGTNPPLYSKFPMSNIGDSRLFVLAKNPDNNTYGLYFGPYSRFAIDDDEIKYSDLDDAEVKFSRSVSPTDFITSIQEEVNK